MSMSKGIISVLNTSVKETARILSIMGEIFREDPILSDEMRKVLEDKENHKKVMEALRSGDQYVELSDGTYQIR